MFYPTERKAILEGATLVNSAVNRYTTIFPLDGTGWTKIILNFHASITWTNANVVDRRGLYRYIKGITLKTSRGEILYDNVPGQALYIANSIAQRTAPVHDVILGATAVYDGVIELILAPNYLNRMEDLILDTGRYSQLELSVTTGSVLDFLDDAVGEAVTVTMDVEIERTLAALAADGKSKPYAHFYMRTYGPFVYSAQNFFDLESALDLGLFGFALKVSATGVTCPFDGAGVDNLTQLTFQDSVRTWVDRAMPWGLKQELHNDLIFEAQNIYLATPATTEQVAYPLLGVYHHRFVKNGSINEHYATGKKSMIRVTYTDATTTDIASLVVWGMRALR